MTVATAPRPGSFRSAWRHRRWRSLVASTTVSTVGDFMYVVTIVVYLIEETDSPGWVAAAVIARMAASTVLGPLGGAIADRFDRRPLMVVIDIVRAGLMAATCVVVVAGGSPLLAVVLVTGVAALGTVYNPVAFTATPLLVPEDDLAAANAAEATSYQLAWFVGPAIGGAVVAVAGTEAAFAINAALFACSALLAVRIGEVRHAARDASESNAADRRPPTIVGDLGAGIAAVRRIPGLSPLTLINCVLLFTFGVEQVVQVFVVTERLGWGPGGVGALNAGLGVGGLLAAPFAGRLAASRRAGRLLGFSGAAIGLTVALLAVTTSPVVAMVLAVIEGMANIAFDVLFMTILQRSCPEALLGRVYGIQESASSLTRLIGTVAAPILVTAVSLQAALVVGGGTLVVLAVVLTPALLAMSERTEAERQRNAPIVARLGALGLFEGASPVALERIARQVRAVNVPGATRVFAEGAEPDDLYVIEVGEVVVSSRADGEIRRLGSGEWFGEIGLLRRIPRTATITTVEDVTLLVVPGSTFLDALTGRDSLPDPIARTMNTRLARTHPHLVETV